ncbi:ATP-binding cassette domain-containing protein, partial [Roseateles sp.]|uniref:ATP-binding cassette domain-containing protein n=1 Tax=Roseateles sp. TaxID=1971397 RepID=UPI003265E0AB
FKAKASKAKQAQSRVKALERMERLAPVLASADFNFEFREPLNLPNPMLMFDEMSVGYGTTTIVRDIDRSVLAGQRIGILGANGQGKSTLVKTIAGTQPALAGTLTQGKGLSIGYFAQQELDVLRLDEGPLEHMVRLAREVGPAGREQELRDFLGQFRFTGEMVNQQVGSLSGGEKARLVLAMLVWQRPNLLLLDEPTNHLDLNTREALSMALNEFEGTVMLVSHDRALLREVCDEFWLVADGVVKPFDGDLDDYQRWLLDQSKEAARAAKKQAAAPAAKVVAAAAPAPAPAPAAREDRKASGQARSKLAEQTRPLRKEMEAIDKRMHALAEERKALEAQLAEGAAASAIAEMGKRLKAISDQLEADEARWLALGEQIEALS